MKIKIKKGKENIFYVSFIVLLVVSFVVFLTSKNFMHDDTPLSQTPFDEKITGLNQTDVVLKKWEYNPDTNIMQVILQMTSVGSDTIKPSISFSARLKNSTDNLPVEVVYKENDMYVVLLKKYICRIQSSWSLCE